MGKKLKAIIVLLAITSFWGCSNEKNKEIENKEVVTEIKEEFNPQKEDIIIEKNNFSKTTLSKTGLEDISINDKEPPKEIIEDFGYDAAIISNKIKKYDYLNNGEKIVFLTFDDGPSEETTPKILDILDKNKIKGTFFVLGKSLDKETSQNILRRIYESGHSIGNHTYSHNYENLYPSRTLNLDNFKEELTKTNELIKSIIGDDFSTRLIRSPGGYNSWNGMNKLDSYLKENELFSIDWNALTGDSEGSGKSSEDLINAAKETSHNKEMVVLLMHDTKGKESTVTSLQEIIDYYKSEGFQFKILK